MKSPDFVFVLPLTKDELLSWREDSPKQGNQYRVEKLLDAKQIEEKLRSVCRIAYNQGPEFILEHFDLFYSCIVKYSALDADQKQATWAILHQAFSDFVLVLKKSLANISCQTSSEENHTILNILKMLSYAFCHFVRCLETESANPALDVTNLAKGRGRGPKKKSAAETLLEPFDRDKTLLAIYQMLQLPLGKLWSPAINPEPNFLKLFTDCVSKALENSALGYVRSKDTRNSIFEILGTLIQRYQQGETVTHRITELINTCEKSIPALTAGVAHLLSVTHYQTLLGQILCLGQRFGSSVLDTDTVRNLSAFLTGLAELEPAVFLPHLPLLSLLLDENNATLRSAVCSVMGEMVAKCLTGENLPANRKHQRDSLLQLLLDHVHDKNAHVRARALRSWTQLCASKAIPLVLLQQLLPRVIGRLKDASSQVRKQSLLLLKSLIEDNPFGPLFVSEPELSKVLAEEEDKLKNLLAAAITEGPAVKKQERQRQWDAMETKVLTTLGDANEDELNEDLTTMPEDLSWAKLLQMIMASLDNNDHVEAVRILRFFMVKSTKIREGLLAWMDLDSEPGNEHDPLPDVEPVQWTSVLRLLYVERELLLTDEEDEENSVSQEISESQANLQKQHHVVDFYQSMKTFGESVNQVLDLLSKLLFSKHVSDTQAAIALIISASKLNVAYATPCVRAMLPLILSKETDIQACILDAFKTLYLDTFDQSKQALAHVVKQLCALPRGATVGELICLQELLSMCMSAGDLPTCVTQKLWQCFVHTTDVDESYAALQILAMAAGGDGELVRRNLETLLQEALGPRSEKDLRWALTSCKMLLKFNACKENPTRLSITHRVFERIIELLRLTLKGRQEFYTNFAVKALELIFELSQDPIVLTEKLLKTLQKELEQDQHSDVHCDSFAVASFVSVVGEAAYRVQIFMEGPVLSQVKKTAADKELRDKAEQQRTKVAKTQHKMRTPAASSVKKRQSQGKDGEEEDELMGAVAYDPEEEMIQQAVEKSVTDSKALFTSYVPFIASLLTDTKSSQWPHVQAAAVVALVKCCLLNVQVCDQHLQLIFSLMAKSPVPGVRSNAIVSAAQLYFRFPNQVDPWAGYLFARLRDQSAQVRLCALERVAELVLQDMMKIKGQASEVAHCLVDPDKEVAKTAETFFEEFAQKGNALYNVIPDLVSRLSTAENPVSDEDFTLIFTTVLSHIKTDKQGDAHASKLLMRLCAARDPSQINKLCICLQKLPVSPKGLKGILDCWRDLQSNITLEVVQETLSTMLTMAKKSKAEAYKGLIEEVEAKLNSLDGETEEVEDEETEEKNNSGDERDNKSKVEAEKTPPRKPSTRGRKGNLSVAKPSTTRLGASKRSTRKRFKIFDSDDSDFDSDF